MITSLQQIKIPTNLSLSQILPFFKKYQFDTKCFDREVKLNGIFQQEMIYEICFFDLFLSHELLPNKKLPELDINDIKNILSIENRRIQVFKMEFVIEAEIIKQIIFSYTGKLLPTTAIQPKIEHDEITRFNLIES